MSTNFSSPQTFQPDITSTAAAGNAESFMHHPNVEQHLVGIILFVVGFCVCLTLFIIISLRDYYFRKHGVDIFDNFRRRRNNDHLESDRAMAEELQRRLNEDEREAERVAKRKEREEWYNMYIKDFTMTAKSEDLFFAHETSSESTEKPSEEQCEAGTRTRFLSTSSLDEELGDMEDLECGAPTTTTTVHDPVACDQNEEDAHLFLRLPVKGPDGACRTVDAQCAICFSDYEEGDEIVWSGLQCQHAFHRDCIFPWLGKGKKRCPMCRHWFVPGTRIEDQKKALEERLRREAQNSSSVPPHDGGDEETRVEECQSHCQQPSTTEIAYGDADVTSTTEDETAATPSSTMSLDSGHESDESDHNHCHTNESDTADDKDTSLRGRCETEEVTLEALDNTIDVV